MNCKNCDTPLSGRTGKKFCSSTCRAQYWEKKNPRLRLDQIQYEIYEFNEISEKVISGVYILLKENELIYIGQSKNIRNRLTAHCGKYDTVIVVMAGEKRKDLEKELIRCYRPSENHTNNPDKITYSTNTAFIRIEEAEKWIGFRRIFSEYLVRMAGY